MCGTGGKIRRRPGITPLRDRLSASEIVTVGGIRCTTDLRKAFDGARSAPTLRDAVVHLDMMRTAGVIDDVGWDDYLDGRAGWRWVKRARRAGSLAVTGSRSPPETRMRLVWVLDAGLPQPVVNRAVFGLDGRFLGIPDCLDQDSGTFLEYDGDEHRDLRHHTEDNVREELFEEYGLAAVLVTRLDMSGSRERLVGRMTRTRLRRLSRDRSLDRWTLTPPPWWTASGTF